MLQKFPDVARSERQLIGHARFDDTDFLDDDGVAEERSHVETHLQAAEFEQVVTLESLRVPDDQVFDADLPRDEPEVHILNGYRYAQDTRGRRFDALFDQGAAKEVDDQDQHDQDHQQTHTHTFYPLHVLSPFSARILDAATSSSYV